MKVLGVIPARYGASRFPGKPLKKILGKPLLQWVVEAANKSKKLDKLLVATDNAKIAGLCQEIAIPYIMTPEDCPTGSDRVWLASQNEEVDIIINIQGDEPLISAQLLDALVLPFEKDKNLDMATLGRRLEAGDLNSNNTAKIVRNKAGHAIYFSRFPIPFSRNDDASQDVCLKHIGLYAYTKNFLQEFCNCPPTALEYAEGLEQLRALYLSAKIAVIEVEHDSWGVDCPEDIVKVEKLLRQRKAKSFP